MPVLVCACFLDFALFFDSYFFFSTLAVWLFGYLLSAFTVGLMAVLPTKQAREKNNLTTDNHCLQSLFLFIALRLSFECKIVLFPMYDGYPLSLMNSQFFPTSLISNYPLLRVMTTRAPIHWIDMPTQARPQRLKLAQQ